MCFDVKSVVKVGSCFGAMSLCTFGMGLALGNGLAHWATLPGWFLMRRGPGVSFLNPWLFVGDPAGIHEGRWDGGTVGGLLKCLLLGVGSFDFPFRVLAAW